MTLIHCAEYSVGSFNLEIHVLPFKKILFSYFFDFFFFSVSEIPIAQILNLLLISFIFLFYFLSLFFCSFVPLSLLQLPQFFFQPFYSGFCF